MPQVVYHYTWRMSTSTAWAQGASCEEICRAATWKNVSTFVQFYKLDVIPSHVSSFSSRVLGSNFQRAEVSAPPSAAEFVQEGSSGSYALARFHCPTGSPPASGGTSVESTRIFRHAPMSLMLDFLKESSCCPGIQVQDLLSAYCLHQLFQHSTSLINSSGTGHLSQLFILLSQQLV